MVQSLAKDLLISTDTFLKKLAHILVKRSGSKSAAVVVNEVVSVKRASVVT